jgi:RNA recognition motif-containing protein
VEEAKRLLTQHFEGCGNISRVFIKSDYAFINFETEEARDEALKLKGSLFQEKSIDVTLPRDQRTERPKSDYSKPSHENEGGWSKPEGGWSKSEVKNYSK